MCVHCAIYNLSDEQLNLTWWWWWRMKSNGFSKSVQLTLREPKECEWELNRIVTEIKTSPTTVLIMNAAYFHLTTTSWACQRSRTAAKLNSNVFSELLKSEGVKDEREMVPLWAQVQYHLVLIVLDLVTPQVFNMNETLLQYSPLHTRQSNIDN